MCLGEGSVEGVGACGGAAYGVPVEFGVNHRFLDVAFAEYRRADGAECAEDGALGGAYLESLAVDAVGRNFSRFEHGTNAHTEKNVGDSGLEVVEGRCLGLTEPVGTTCVTGHPEREASALAVGCQRIVGC